MYNLVKRVFGDDNFVKSDGIYLYTDDNKEIIDSCSNSMNVNLGYGVLEIEKVIHEQIRKINFMHTGKGTTYESLMLANRLHDIIKPYGNYKVYFATSGSDCIEAALRISVLYQQKNKRNQESNTRFATFEGSYHGSTLGALSVSGHRKFQKLYNGYIGNCLTIPTRWNLEWEMDFTDITAFVLDSMITNPIGSEMIDRDYLNYLVQICKESGVITIIDEIATSAFGYSITTSRMPVIFLQNSGLGNILDPVQSLVGQAVYNHPMLYIIGFRGGTDDAPQHSECGKVTKKLLEISQFDIYEKDYFTNALDTDIRRIIDNIKKKNKSAAILVDKEFFSDIVNIKNYQISDYNDILNKICAVLEKEKDSIVLTSTGYITRHMENVKDTYKKNFVHIPMPGSLGQTISFGAGICMGTSINNKKKKIYIIDGDGSLFMHMGSLALFDYYNLDVTYILLNNYKHLSVGGENTLASSCNFFKLAESMNFDNIYSSDNLEVVDFEEKLNQQGKNFIEIICSNEVTYSLLERMDFNFEEIKQFNMEN
ncbi:aminotransferase class III-fold pyridoxal phosphate-dependent enzyme [Streptococcus pneumoniae]|nr:aminotransferase class III-fold pyridoxal phosphate-dependent enzyme [Streptococcus pneumoniae]